MRRLSIILKHLNPRLPFYTARRTMANIPQTMRAMAIPHHGDVSVIEEAVLPTPTPKAGELLVKIEWAGVNFIDTYVRKGLYPHKGPWPVVIGTEAAGEIVQLPPDAESLADSDPWFKAFDYKLGVKVAIKQQGVFAEYVAVNYKNAFPLPPTISTRTAAASFTQGLTALTFVIEAYNPQPGEWILIHTAAGGLGLLLTQLAAAKGVKVIGTTSTEEKAKIAKENGATEMIIYTKEDTVSRVLEITGGQGVSGIFDGVGKDTWENNFKVIRRKGTIVSIGNASGVVPPFPPLKLSEKNIKVCRPSVFNYLVDLDEIKQYVPQLWDLLAKGTLQVKVHKEYPFTADGAREAHTDIVGRSTVGKLIVKIAK